MKKISRSIKSVKKKAKGFMGESGFSYSEKDFQAFSEHLTELVYLMQLFKEEHLKSEIKQVILHKAKEIGLLATSLGGAVESHAQTVLKDISSLIEKPGSKEYNRFLEDCVKLKNNLWSL